MGKRLLFIIAIAVIAAATYLLTRDETSEVDASVSVAEAMAGDTTGYRRAGEVRDFAFPRDHGPHPGFKTEWWYLTGNLEASGERHVGYQFTLFRVALAPPDTGRSVRMAAPDGDTSDWATDQLYMGHFTVSDVQNERFYAFERFSRAAAGLAGAQAVPFRVWLEDWTLAGTDDGAAFPARIRAAEEGVAIDLTVAPRKPHVLQGDRGLSQKGSEHGNASYYYSYTRLTTEGTVALGGDTLRVAGQSWMDREWSTSALGEEQVGWDWFALQLDDGRDLMYYQIRQTDDTPSPYTEGVLVDEEGSTARLRRADVALSVLDHWTSPTGAVYPARWRVRVPGEDLDLTVTPYFEQQELDVSVQYWEGAVRIEGTADGQPVSGSGYVEMTGYGDNNARPPS